MAATAYAAYGWVEAARRALDRAVKGPAWDAALEQRLFVETLLDTFEGERAAACARPRCSRGCPLPAPAPSRDGASRACGAASPRSRARLPTRAATGTLACFARRRATSPLVHWAMRYARAIVAVDTGYASDVPMLLSGAPARVAAPRAHSTRSTRSCSVAPSRA